MSHISTANKVLPKLAPRIVMKAFPVNAYFSVHPGAEVEIEKRTHASRCAMNVHMDGQIRKKQEVKDLPAEYHDLFALDSLRRLNTRPIKDAYSLKAVTGILNCQRRASLLPLSHFTSAFVCCLVSQMHLQLSSS